MTRTTLGTFALSAVALAAMLCAADASPASAQCCGTPAVAYSPVVVQPQTTVVRTGWYPGYLLDRMRLNRWAANTTVATPAVAAAPTYSVGYAPAYTAAYAPAAYTANYAPYITAYAPLQPTVVQASYAAPAVSAGCSTCAQPTTVSYAPATTVYRPVELTPVVSAPACTTCSVEAPCNACSACSTTVSHAGYVESPAADCPGCAASAGTPVYDYGTSTQPAPPQGAAQSPPQGSPATPPPSLKPEVAPPAGTTYGEPAEGANGAEQQKSIVPTPGADDATGPEADPANTDSSTSYDFQAPPLLGPSNDRTAANRPTVDVHNAVYTRPSRPATRVSTTAAKPAPAVDANGWFAVD